MSSQNKGEKSLSSSKGKKNKENHNNIIQNITKGAQLYGYLIKQGGSWHSWKKRFFVLKDNKISYFKDDQHSDPLGVLYIDGETVAEKRRDKKANLLHTDVSTRREITKKGKLLRKKSQTTIKTVIRNLFTVSVNSSTSKKKTLNSRVYYISAETEGLREAWVTYIQDCVAKINTNERGEKIRESVMSKDERSLSEDKMIDSESSSESSHNENNRSNSLHNSNKEKDKHDIQERFCKESGTTISIGFELGDKQFDVKNFQKKSLDLLEKFFFDARGLVYWLNQKKDVKTQFISKVGKIILSITDQKKPFIRYKKNCVNIYLNMECLDTFRIRPTTFVSKFYAEYFWLKSSLEKINKLKESFVSQTQIQNFNFNIDQKFSKELKISSKQNKELYNNFIKIVEVGLFTPVEGLVDFVNKIEEMKKIFLQSITIIELGYGNKNQFKLVKNTLKCKFTTDYISHPKGWGQITEKAIVIYLHSTGVIDLNTMNPTPDTFPRDRINTEMQNTRRNGPTLNSTPSLRDIKIDESTLNDVPKSKEKIVNPFDDIKVDDPLPFNVNETLIEDLTHKASFKILRMSNIYIEKLLESPFLQVDQDSKSINDPNNISSPFTNPFLDEDIDIDNKEDLNGDINDQEDNITTQESDHLSEHLNYDEEDRKQPRMYKSRQVIDGDNVIDICSLEITNDDLKNYNFKLVD